MKILVIAANCIQVNSSANLCHLSYINGLIDSGHMVDLLTVNNKGSVIDASLVMPNVRKKFEFNGSLYDRLHKKKYTNSDFSFKNNIPENNSKTSSNILKKAISKTISSLKKFIHNLYGVYETSIIWYHNAKKFKSDEKYDCVISLSFPPTSHLLSVYLKNKNKVKASRWIQIWEDPWSTDVIINAIQKKNAHKAAEQNLLKNASEILYVSPLTLMYQQKLFPENASKMRWEPLPTYFVPKNENVEFSKLSFGYFGDYNSKVRNIKPFYNVSINNNLDFTVCGITDLNLKSSETVSIYPRLPLDKLSIHEKKANVLVFLCNIKGGQIPGKIYQYSATNKFILFILDGTDEEKHIIKDYFSNFNRYVFCENNEESIMEAIKYIKENIDKTELFSPIDNFEPKKIIKKILES